MHPVDHVVADVERIGVGRQHLDDESVRESRGLEGLVPPRRAFDERAADRLGHAVVDVIDDRLPRFEAMPRDPVLRDRTGEGRRVVVEVDTKESDARVGAARREAGRRRLHEGVMLAHGHDVRGGRDVAYQIAGTIGGRERQRRFDFSVARERFRVRQIERAAILVERVRALLRLAQTTRDAMRVAEKKISRVDEDAVRCRRLDFKRREHRLRKRFFDRATLGSVVRQRAIRVVRLNHEHARADALEADDVRRAELMAIESDRVRADA